MNQTNSKPFAPEKNCDPESQYDQMGWTELAALYEQFPPKICDRFELIVTLYDDGICNDEVVQELQEHIEDCVDCQTCLKEYRSMSRMFANRRSVDFEISDQDIQKSLKSFISQYGDELFGETLEEEGHNDGRPLSSHQSAQPYMQVEFNPQKKKSLRFGFGLGVLTTAAMFFAYGPALIETSITETSFPAQTQDVLKDTQVVVSDHNDYILPFSKLLGQELSRSDQMIVQLISIHSHSQTSGPLVAEYTFSLNEKEKKVELSSAPLTSKQRDVMMSRLKKDGEAFSYTFNGQVHQKYIKHSYSNNITQIEYISDDHHTQWMTTGDQSKEILLAITKAHLSK